MRGVIRFGGGEVVAPDDGPKPSLAFLTNGVEEVRINTNVNAATKVCARERTLDVSVVCDASFSISSLCLPLWQNDAIFYDDGTLCILVMKFALMKIRKHS